MNLFATGFPGFIARRLIPQLTREGHYKRIILLVEKRFERTAREAAQKLLSCSKADIVVGDITVEGMGIGDPSIRAALLEEESEWWHLAAVYRLDVGLDMAKKVNVEGTRNVLDAARKAARVHRFNYVSTAYVSGLETGLVGEDDLPEPRPENFKNFYELTKNEAEWLVRAERRNLPVSIYRFGVVTGDSKTGATEKFDGPYFIIKYFHNWGYLPLPMIGDMDSTINIVPVDFVCDATVAISRSPQAVGKCFHIVDPDPITTRELFLRVAEASGRKPPRWKLSPAVMDKLMRLKPMRKIIAIPREAMIYMNHSVTYNCANTLRALEGTGIACPPAPEYIPKLVEFYRRNRHRSELHLKIQ